MIEGAIKWAEKTVEEIQQESLPSQGASFRETKKPTPKSKSVLIQKSKNVPGGQLEVHP